MEDHSLGAHVRALPPLLRSGLLESLELVGLEPLLLAQLVLGDALAHRLLGALHGGRHALPVGCPRLRVVLQAGFFGGAEKGDIEAGGDLRAYFLGGSFGWVFLASSISFSDFSCLSLMSFTRKFVNWDDVESVLSLQL